MKTSHRRPRCVGEPVGDEEWDVELISLHFASDGYDPTGMQNERERP
jgi:hypothetical protein